MDPLLYVLDLVVFIGIFSIVAISLNLEFGFTGLANFGKVAFFLIGAYTYALLSNIGVPFFFCLMAGAVIAAAFGLLISLPALRLRADYLSIAVLAFGEILRLFVKSEDWLAGGDWGLTVAPAISVAGVSHRTDAFINIALVYFCLAICFLVIHYLANAPYGRAIRAIREDEVAAEALGKNVSKYKAQVLMLGSAMTGIAGGLYVQYLHCVLPNMFMPMITFTVWIMVLLGGPGNSWGVLLGAGLVEIFDRGTNILKDYISIPIDPSNLQYILFGTLIILILLYRPQGLLKESTVRTKVQRLIYNGRHTIKNRRN
ncbi:MAG: branched-chain amino acid ABC transporter permease [Dehalococcoidales bacterium]|nr:branched-chain amino acid ABC transporter permease [Dehalococcoidales bacterium]